MRLLSSSRRSSDERLLWSRDVRFVRQLADATPGARMLDLAAGAVLIGPVDVLTDGLTAEVASDWGDPEYGLVSIDTSIPEAERYLYALSAAVQASGIADRIGMSGRNRHSYSCSFPVASSTIGWKATAWRVRRLKK